LKYKKSPGRPAKLTKSQRDTLAQRIEEGPSPNQPASPGPAGVPP
jgi:transposase